MPENEPSPAMKKLRGHLRKKREVAKWKNLDDRTEKNRRPPGPSRFWMRRPPSPPSHPLIDDRLLPEDGYYQNPGPEVPMLVTELYCDNPHCVVRNIEIVSKHPNAEAMPTEWKCPACGLSCKFNWTLTKEEYNEQGKTYRDVVYIEEDEPHV